MRLKGRNRRQGSASCDYSQTVKQCAQWYVQRGQHCSSGTVKCFEFSQPQQKYLVYIDSILCFVTDLSR